MIWFLRSLQKSTEAQRLRLIVLSILVVYIAGVFVITIGVRGFDNETKINLIPFRTAYFLIRQLNNSARTWGIKNIPHELTFMAPGLRNVIGNILLLLPLGYLVPLVWKRIDSWRKAALLGISASLLIEITQLITHHGYFDVDDIILNAGGCILGWLCYSRWIAEEKSI